MTDLAAVLLITACLFMGMSLVMLGYGLGRFSAHVRDIPPLPPPLPEEEAPLAEMLDCSDLSEADWWKRGEPPPWERT